MANIYTIDIKGTSGWNSTLYFEDKESAHKYLCSAYELVLVGSIESLELYFNDILIHRAVNG